MCGEGEKGGEPTDRRGRYGWRKKGGRMARRAGGSAIISRLKQRATPEDSPLIHTVVLQARTSLAGDMKHTHTSTHTHTHTHTHDGVVIHRITHRLVSTHTLVNTHTHTHTHTSTCTYGQITPPVHLT